jgi:hypothetical protein
MGKLIRPWLVVSQELVAAARIYGPGLGRIIHNLERARAWCARP